MSLIMGLMGLKRLELFTLELEKLLHLTLFTLASTIGHQTWSRFLLEFDYSYDQIRMIAVIYPWSITIPLFDFVYSLASTIINQSEPNLVKRYRDIRSCVSSIIGVIGPEQLELFALEFEKLLYFTLFTL